MIKISFGGYCFPPEIFQHAIFRITEEARQGQRQGGGAGRGYVPRNFMTPLPVAESFEALNAQFLEACTKRRPAILRGHTTTFAGRMQADRGRGTRPME
ncbi:MAG: hypothetical protein ACR2KT_01760 [Methylocella sp.]